MIRPSGVQLVDFDGNTHDVPDQALTCIGYSGDVRLYVAYAPHGFQLHRVRVAVMPERTTVRVVRR